MKTLKVGLIGCGNISGIYFKNLCSGRWPQVKLVACADIDMSRAQACADAHRGVRALTVDALIASDDVDIVLNLTIPQVHFSVGMRCIQAGKHHYSEKPMCICPEEARELLAAAREHGVLTCCAPDTFMGSGVQTMIEAVDTGKIGAPVHVIAHMLCAGHESWHPSPDFYYKQGGGPLHDMGPYYLTAMVAMLGAVKTVSATASQHFMTRTIRSGARKGEVIPVETPSHLNLILEFDSGVSGTLVTSFDCHGPVIAPMYVCGTEGALEGVDPNGFMGDVKIKHGEDIKVLEPVFSCEGNMRGLGLVDMVNAIHEGRKPRACGELAAHVLEVIDSAYFSAESGQRMAITACERPLPFRG